MKRVIALLLALTMTVSMAACGKKTSEEPAEAGTQAEPEEPTEPAEAAEETDGGEPLKVGFSLPSMTFPFYVRMYEQIEAEADKRGWEVSFVDGNLDAGTQMNGLQDMINNGVDIMVIATWYIDALTDIFVQCEQKGIPVFLMDNMMIPAECETAITFTTGTDNYNAGVIGGTWYADYLKENELNSINIILLSSQTEQPTKRCGGFTDTIEAAGIEVNILNNYNAGKRETALSCAEDALTAYKDLTVAFGGSAQDSLGAYDATVGANRTEVAIFGFDGEDEELELIDGGTNYLATITQDPKGQATLLAENVDKWLAGETIEQIQETPAGVYGPDGQLSGAEILGQ